MSGINQLLSRIKKLAEKYSYVLLFIIFAVFLVSRLLKLAHLPYGVHVDEIAGALDGYYLSHYGMDRNLWHMPPHLMNFINGQSALYAYSLALVLKFVPYSITAVRIPPVIWGSVAFFYSYKLVKELFDGDKAIALLGPVFFTIFPFIMSSERWGLDCNLYLSLGTISLYYFIIAMKSEKTKYYVTAGIWMGLTLYTYAISYVTTIIFLVLTFAYMLYIKRFDFKKWAIMAIPCFVLALPLILFIMVNMDILPEFSLFGSDVKKMIEYRGGQITLYHLITNFTFIPKLFLGGDGLTYNAFDIPAFGTVYIFMAPVIVVGIVWCIVDMVKRIKEKEFDEYMFVFIFFICALLGVLLVDGPSINNANQIYITFIVFAVYAIVKITKKWYMFTPIILVASAIFFLAYSKFYFKDQRDRYGHQVLFYGTACYELVEYSERMYNPTGEKTVYLEEQYEDLEGEVLMLSALKDVPPDEFSYDRTEFRNVKLHFPGEFDENEDAIYILGYNWNHIASYLTTIGFNVDTTFDKYLILYR